MPQEETTDETTELNSRIVSALRQIVESQESWQVAMQDPKNFLQNKLGIKLPNDIEVELYDLARDTHKTGLYAAELFFESNPISQTDPTYQPRFLSEAMIDILTRLNQGCPLGTMPYKTLRKTSKCVKYGVIRSQLEWIPVEEGSPLGYFGYRNITKVCIQSVTTTEEVIECLPWLVLTEAP